MWPLAFAVLFETRFAMLEAGLGVAAQASPRPRECRGASGASGVDDGLWSRLRGSDAQRYCDLLARGYARLREAPKEALSAAQAAEALGGATPAVRVLSGRAELRLGQGALAYDQFTLAEAADAQSFGDPKALHDYARAASLAYQPEQAVRLYRLLMSRAALLDDARERAFAQIEAAAHLLAQTPNSADEALGYLSQARGQTLGLSAWVSALRLLSQEHGHAGARVAPGTRLSAAALGSPPQVAFSDEFPLLLPGQFELLRAALGESSEPAAAKGKAR